MAAMSGAPDDPISLLRSLRAAGERTGAVEAEGALHLRRNSRRTIDGIHELSSQVSLPASKLGASGPATSTPGTANGSASLGAPPSNPPSCTAGGPATPGNGSHATSPGTSISGGAAATAPTTNGNGISNATNGSQAPQQPSSPLTPLNSSPLPSGFNSLPLITSTASSPAASPSRLAARSPIGSFPIAAGSALGSPASPTNPPPGVLSGVHRRTSYLTHESSHMPHSHGSPLPLIFDSPYLSSSPTGPPVPMAAAMPGLAPPSPSLRVPAPGLASPTAGSASLPSIGAAGAAGAAGAGTGGVALPTAPMPSMLTASGSLARVQSGRAASAAAALTAAAAGGGTKPLPPAPSSPNASASAAAAGPPTPSAPGASSPVPMTPGRPLRPLGASGSPGVSLPAATGASSSPGHPPQVSSPGGSVPSPGGSLTLGSPTRSLAGADHVTLDFARQHPQGPLQRPASARSGPGAAMGSGVSNSGSEGFNASMSVRRLSMTGGLELTLGGSQKLVMAAAHELSTIAQHTQHGGHGGAHSTHGGQSLSGAATQQQSPLQLQQLASLLPPPSPQLPPPWFGPPPGSARGVSNTVSGGGGNSTASGGLGSSHQPGSPFAKVPGRDARLSDPGLSLTVSGVMAAPGAEGGTHANGGRSAAAAAPPTVPDSPSVGRPSLVPLPAAAVQLARAKTPPAAVASGPLPYVPTPARTGRPDPLPLSARRGSTGGTAALAAASPEQSPTARAPTPLARAGVLAPMDSPRASGSGAAASSPTRSGPGPVAESALGSTPSLDPAALFGPSVGSRPGSNGASNSMELTVRAMAGGVAGSAGGAGGSSGSAAGGGGVTAVQSSVRQKLQADPLRFHPPATAGHRRLPSGDPLESTPRLVLGNPQLHRHLLPHLDCGPPGGGSGGSASPICGPSSNGELWVPSQDILPHMVGRTNSAGGSCARWHPAGGGGGGGGGSGGTVTFSPLRGPGTPSGGSGSGGIELPTPRFRTLSANGIPVTPGSGSGGASTSGGSAASIAATTTPPPLHRPQPATQHANGASGQPSAQAVGLQSNYLQALAAAAGLDGGDGGNRRARSLSDSGCAAFLAAADCGPVGLSLAGGLNVLGGDMWSRIQAAERHHNTRYSATAVAAPGEGRTAYELSNTLDDSGPLPDDAAQPAGTPAASQPSPAGGPDKALKEVSYPRTPAQNMASISAAAATAASTSTTASVGSLTQQHSQAPSGRSSLRSLGSGGGSGAASPCGPAAVAASGPSVSPTSPAAAAAAAAAAGMGMGMGTAGGHIRLDASVSSLPLRALKAPNAGGAGAKA